LYVQKNELDILLSVTACVSGLWEHNGSSMPELSDPVSILREVTAGGEFRCVDYSIVAVDQPLSPLF